MTKTASKHGLKAAAKEKSNRHAQRTPLPPRAETVAAIKEMVEEMKAPATGGGKSRPKADAFTAEIAKTGWKATEVVAGDHIELTATRGEKVVEVIFIEWTGGVYQPTATYAIADRTVKLRNASAAKQYAGRTPEVGQAELERVATNKAFKKRDPEPKDIAPAKLPFDVREATESELLDWALGRTITWHNRISNSTETAMVLANPRRVKFVEHGEDRIMMFLCPNTGFRACRLSAIVRFGKGQSGYTPRAVAEAERGPAGRVSRKKVGAK